MIENALYNGQGEGKRRLAQKKSGKLMNTVGKGPGRFLSFRIMDKELAIVPKVA